MIEVEHGMILSLQFTAFDIHSYYDTCDHDHLTITDGDGMTLMEKSCGSTSYSVYVGGQNIGNSLPPNITSTSNIVKLVFRTDSSTTRPGWNVSWSALTPGKSHWF